MWTKLIGLHTHTRAQSFSNDPILMIGLDSYWEPLCVLNLPRQTVLFSSEPSRTIIIIIICYFISLPASQNEGHDSTST